MVGSFCLKDFGGLTGVVDFFDGVVLAGLLFSVFGLL